MVQGNVYAQWRVRGGIVSGLREDVPSPPPERLLQVIWHHQRLRRDELRTLEGQPLRVLHPGFQSREGGPDFRGAVLQFGSEPPRSGDVEVDVRSAGWCAHHHDRNPAFGNVILHVVWDGAGAREKGFPTVALLDALDSPLRDLNWWLGSEAAQTLPEALRGRCSTLLRGLSAERLAGLLHQAAQLRLHGKAAQLQARARQAGWDQALWEGLFRALGYKQNLWPMQRLAELRNRWLRTGKHVSPLALQARLFGVSGLLPTELERTTSGADGYLRRIWDQWWREREELSDCVLPVGLWQFHGLRPANQPQRRLALAAHWLAAGNLPNRLQRWCLAPFADNKLLDSLFKLLRVEYDDFWSWHWTIRSARSSRVRPLLGPSRVTDLAMNVILPWLWIRGVEGKNTALQAVIEHRYFVWPAGQDNALLRQARERLMGASSRRAVCRAAAQQGLIQIMRDFCDHTNAVCDDCPFPELVRHWDAGGRSAQD